MLLGIQAVSLNVRFGSIDDFTHFVAYVCFVPECADFLLVVGHAEHGPGSLTMILS